MKGSKHLITIGILGVIFFALIFISTSSSGITTEYTFNDLEVKMLPSYENKLLLGSVKVSNDGVIPKRVFLDQFVVCQLSETLGDETYKVEYRGNTHKEYNDVFSSPYSYLNYVEVSGGDSVELEVSPEIYRYNLIDEIKQNDLNGKTVPFYIFKVDMTDRNNRYDYCSSVKKEDAHQIINVKFDLDESELDEDGKVKTYQE